MPSGYDADVNISVGTDLDLNSLTKTADKLESQFERIFDSAIGKKSSTKFKQLEIQATKSLSRMKELVNEINDIQFNSEPSEEVEFFTNKLNDLKKQFAETKKALQEKIDLGGSKEEIGALEDKLSNIKIQADKTIGNLENAFTNQIQSAVLKAVPLAEELRDVENSLVITKQKMIEAGESTHSFKSVISSLISRLSVFIKQLARVASQKIVSGLKNLSSRFLNIGRNVRRSSSGIKQFIRAALGIGSLMVLFNKLKSAISEGLGNMEKYSPEFKATMDSFRNSLSALKNAFGAAFAPIASVVLPLLSRLIAAVTAAVNAIGKLIAALTGKKTYTAAVSGFSDVAGAAGGANSAAQELQKTLSGFDDVEILKGNDAGGGGGGGGGGGASDMFEEVPIDDNMAKLADMIKEAWEKADFTEIGTLIGTKLRDALDNIPWDSIKEKLRQVAKSVATFLNGFFETPGLFDAIGRTIAEAINSAIEFLYEFASNLHWDSIGTALADGLNGAIANLDWTKLGATIGEWVSGLLSLFVNWVTKTNWYELGASIGSMITSAIQNTNWSNFGLSIAGAINALVQFIKGIVINTDFAELAHGLANAIITFFAETDWSEFGETVKEIFKALGTFFGTLADDLDLAGLGKALMQDLWDAIKDHAGLMFIWWSTAFPGLLFNAIADGINSIIPKLNEVINQLLDPFDLVPDIEIPLIAKIKDPTAIYDAAKSAIENSSKKSNVQMWAEALLEKIKDQIPEAQKELSTTAMAEEMKDMRKNKGLSTTADVDKMEDKRGPSDKSLTTHANMTTQSDNRKDKTLTTQANFTGRTALDSASWTGWRTLAARANFTGKAALTAASLTGWRTLATLANFTGRKDSIPSAQKLLGGFTARQDWWKDNISASKKLMGWFTARQDWWDDNISASKKLMGWFTARQDWFSDNISYKTIGGFVAQITSFRDELRDRVIGLWGKITQVFSAKGGIYSPYNGWSSIPQYAGGTTNAGRSRPHGTMFIAGEAGPEVVGHINGRTEILNKSQIASAIYAAVKTAMLIGMNQLRSIIPIPMPINIDINALQIPDIVKGCIIPYETRLSVLEDKLANQNPDAVTNEELRKMLADVITAVNKVQFYIGDEQIARHSQLGNQKLDRRYNPVIQGA